MSSQEYFPFPNVLMNIIFSYLDIEIKCISELKNNIYLSNLVLLLIKISINHYIKEYFQEI